MSHKIIDFEKALKQQIEDANEMADKDGIDDYAEGYHRGYAEALKGILDFDYEFQVAVIKTPADSIAMCVFTINAMGEIDNHPYTGYLCYRDANNKHWIVDDGEVLPFDAELLEVICEEL